MCVCVFTFQTWFSVVKTPIQIKLYISVTSEFHLRIFYTLLNSYAYIQDRGNLQLGWYHCTTTIQPVWNHFIMPISFSVEEYHRLYDSQRRNESLSRSNMSKFPLPEDFQSSSLIASESSLWKDLQFATSWSGTRKKCKARINKALQNQVPLSSVWQS